MTGWVTTNPHKETTSYRVVSECRVVTQDRGRKNMNIIILVSSDKQVQLWLNSKWLGRLA